MKNRLRFAGCAAALAVASASCGSDLEDQGYLESSIHEADRGAVLAIDVSVWSEMIAPDEISCFWDRGFRHIIAGTQYLPVTRQQLDVAVAGGMSVDVYVYLYWNESIATQVQEALDLAAEYPVGTVWLDVEEDPAGRTGDEIGDLVQEGLDLCGSVRCGIYSGWGYWLTYMNDTNRFADVPLWYARYDGLVTLSNWAHDGFGGWLAPEGKQYNEKYVCGVSTDVNIFKPAVGPELVLDRTPPTDDGNVPAAPSGLFPDGGYDVSTEYAKLYCDSIPGAVRYEFEVEHFGRDGRFIRYGVFRRPQDFLELYPTLGDRSYRFRVRAQNRHGLSPWSSWAHFDYGRPQNPYEGGPETEPSSPPSNNTPPSSGTPQSSNTPAPVPGAPENLRPSNGAVLTGASVRLECDPISGATGYEFDIEYAVDGAYRRYFGYSAPSATKTFYPTVRWTDYRFRVRASTSGSQSPWSNWAEFSLQ